MSGIPEGLKPATWGCTHGAGVLGEVIRRAEVEMSRSPRFPAGDAEASWAGHVVVYLGMHDFGGQGRPEDQDHAIVEAEFPKVVISRASCHPDTIWATGQPLADTQRTGGARAALALVGHDYDALAYLYFVEKVTHVALTSDLRPLLAGTAELGPICSGVMVRVQEAMGVDLGPLKTAATQDPDYVSPADCLRWGLDNGWMSGPVPASTAEMVRAGFTPGSAAAAVRQNDWRALAARPAPSSDSLREELEAIVTRLQAARTEDLGYVVGVLRAHGF